VSITFNIIVDPLDCTDDTLTLVTPIGTQLPYYFGEGVRSLQPVFSQTTLTCPITYSLTVDGSTSFDSSVFKIDAVTGELQINTSDELTYDLKSSTFEITATSTLSSEVTAIQKT